MKQEIKPIKRSKELAPLSRQHHEGLLFAWKLRQGIQLSIDAKRITAFVHWFWPLHLVPHFKKEEEILTPVLRSTSPLIQQMFAEHDVLRGMVDAVNNETSFAQLTLLADTITNHIRFEERVLFNEIERVATPDQMQFINTNLQHEKYVDVWEDQFWIKKK